MSPSFVSDHAELRDVRAHDPGRVAALLAAELRPDAVNVLVGHGNAKHPEFNRPLADVAARLAALGVARKAD